MDVVGNNIANVNTVGFKTSRVTFKEMYSQTLRSASTPSPNAGGIGGVNPMQVGLGTMVGSIDVDMSPTTIESTGHKSDLAIDGKGYLILRSGDSSELLYTRAGNMKMDGAGFLTHTGTGNRLQGYMITDPEDITSVGGSLVDLYIPSSENMAAAPTTRVELSGNLSHKDVPKEEDEEGVVPNNKSCMIEVIDQVGGRHNIIAQFYQETDDPSAPQWRMELSMQDPYDSIDGGEGVTLTFDMYGNLIAEGEERYLTVTLSNGGDADPDVDGPQVGGFTEEMEVVIDLSKITQHAGQSDVVGMRLDGNEAGKMTDWDIDQNGVVSLFFSNGLRRNYARVALANFSNDAGLTKVSDTTFMESNNSGAAVVSIANSGDYGKVLASSLEMSNVDLAYEFTSMVITQRGYQANARVISTSDEILQELVNIKR